MSMHEPDPTESVEIVRRLRKIVALGDRQTYAIDSVLSQLTEAKFDRERAEAQLKAVVEVVTHEADMLEAHGEVHRSSREFLATTVERLLAAAQEKP